MNKTLHIAVVAILILIAGTLAFAGQSNVRWTVHNLSNNTNNGNGLNKAQRHFYSDTVDQVCIFCHTPHNAAAVSPLWNKATVAAGQQFMMYTSSKTLTTAARQVTAPGPESLLCLSCHDGRTAINILHSSGIGTPTGVGNDKTVDIMGWENDASIPGGIGVSLGSFSGFGSYPANLGATANDPYAGTDLTNDHPISVPYDTAQGQSAGRLNPRAGIDPRIKFFGASYKVECSSCHDPHVDYGYGIDRIPSGSPTGDTTLTPFLRMSNAGSSLCLACHNK